MSLIIFRAVLVGLVAVYSVDCEKWWPNFSCHPATDTPSHRQSASINRNGWRNCVEKNEKYKEGNCPRVCRLLSERVIYQKNKPDGPIIFDTEKFIEFFADELGYQMKKLEGDVKQLMDNTRVGIKECKNKHPEYEGLKNLKTAVCEPWEAFLQCLDKAVGC